MKIIINRIQITTSILLFATSIILQSAISYAELYQNYDGSYLNEEQYESRVLICSELQQKNGIDESIDCLNWTLTEEGNQRINEYLHFQLYGE